MNTTLYIPSMCCPVEGGAVERALGRVEGVLGVTCDYASRAVSVRHELRDSAPLVEAVSALGMPCRVAGARRRTLRAEGMSAAVDASKIRQALEAGGLRSGLDIRLSEGTLAFDGDDLRVQWVRRALGQLGYEASEIEETRETVLFSVPEMDCPVEAGEIERAFARSGLPKAAFDTAKRTVSFTGTPEEAGRAAEAIRACGYSALRLGKKDEGKKQAAPIPWKRYGLALAIALLSEIGDLLLEYRPETLPLPEGLIGAAVKIAALAAILMAGLSVFKSGLTALRHGNLNMNALMSVAVAGGVLIGAWPEAAMVMVLFQISEAIERLASERARRSIRDLMDVTPEQALVRREDGTFAPEPVELVGPGALVRVAPGERVPLDGRIAAGATSLDQSMVTGEGLPVEKGEGAQVWAGTVNLTGTIEVEVTRAASEGLAARIIRAVEDAQASKSPVQRFVDRFARVYTPLVFVFAAVVAFIPPLFLGDWPGWFYKALCLLVIACPCALVISTPVTIVSALSSAARRGILVKGGLYLEEARKLRCVALDKTGTLTMGEPSVSEVTFAPGVDEKRAAALAASLAAMNKHPLSRAILAWTEKRGVGPWDVSGFQAIAGSGVSGRVGSARVFLVSARWLEAKGKLDAASRTAFERARAAGMSSVALADFFGVQAVFAMADEPRETASEGLRALEREGIRTVLLTGDSREAAETLGQKLGLTDIRAELLPEEKLEAIAELQKEGVTAMVGDGINDAPALARADIGIAMGVRGTESAMEAAHVALMDDRIGSVATLVRLSRITHRVLVENIAFALLVKVLFAALALGGMASMWMAVFADVGTCLIVVANGLRMTRAGDKIEGKA